MSSGIKTFRRYSNPVEANIIMGKLRAHDIDCFLTNENSMLNNLNPALSGIKLMLREEDFERAEQILKQDTEDNNGR